MGSSILVGDESRDSRYAISELLRHAGYDVYGASTGEDVLRLAVVQRPDLVILEVELPGVPGYDVCHRLRETFGEALPILFISETRVEPLDRIAAFLIGGDDYLVKPVSAADLLSRVRRALMRSQKAKSRRRPAA